MMTFTCYAYGKTHLWSVISSGIVRISQNTICLSFLYHSLYKLLIQGIWDVRNLKYVNSKYVNCFYLEYRTKLNSQKLTMV